MRFWSLTVVAFLFTRCVISRATSQPPPVVDAPESVTPTVQVDDEEPAPVLVDPQPEVDQPDSEPSPAPVEQPGPDPEPIPDPVPTTPRISGDEMTFGSPGCGKASPTGNVALAMTIADHNRIATISVPNTYQKDKAYPIVFAFHGCMSSTIGPQGYLLSQRETKQHAIIVYPKSIGHDDCWFDGFAGTDGDLDAALFIEMREQVRKDYCVDMKRTFVTGHSQGALLSNNLACRFGNAEITAVATNAGSLNADLTNGTDANYRGLPDDAFVYDAQFEPDDYHPTDAFGPFQLRQDTERSPNCAGSRCNPDYQAGAYRQSANEFLCPVDGAPGTTPTPRPKLPPPFLLFHGSEDSVWHVSVQRGREAARHWAYVAQCDADPVAMAHDANVALDNADPCGRPQCAAGHEIVYCEPYGVGHEIWDPDSTNGALYRTWDFFAKY